MDKEKMKREFHIVFEEELSIKVAPKLKESLINALVEYEEIRIIVRPPSVLDLSCLQLLMAAQRQANILDRKLELELELPDSAAELLEQAGFHDFIEKYSHTVRVEKN